MSGALIPHACCVHEGFLFEVIMVWTKSVFGIFFIRTYYSLSRIVLLACDSRSKLCRNDMLAFQEAKIKVRACANLYVRINSVKFIFMLSAANFK